MPSAQASLTGAAVGLPEEHHAINAKEPIVKKPTIKKLKPVTNPPLRYPSEEKIPFLITATITHPVQVLGKQGFDPKEVSIDLDDSVTWTNNDPLAEDITLTIHKSGTRKFMTTPILKFGQQGTLMFTEKGTWTYWSVEYGVKGKIVVE